LRVVRDEKSPYDIAVSTVRDGAYVYELLYDENGWYFSDTGSQLSDFTAVNTMSHDTDFYIGTPSAGYKKTDAAGAYILTKTETKWGSISYGMQRFGTGGASGDATYFRQYPLEIFMERFLLWDTQKRFKSYVATKTAFSDSIYTQHYAYPTGFYDSAAIVSFITADSPAWDAYFNSTGLPWGTIDDVKDVTGDKLTYPTTGGVSDLPGYETDTTTPGTGDNSSSQVVYPGVTFDPASGGYGRYWLTGTQMTDLHNFLYSETFINNFKRVFSDPIDSLINITSYPFTYNTAYTTAANVTMGGVESDIAAYKMSNSSIAPRINFGYCAVQRYYNSYLDYAPYTAVSIYLPYIGIRPLQVSAVMNDIVYCEYVIDLNNQMVTAYISVEKSSREAASNVPIASYTGNIGVNLPMAGVSNTEKIATVLNTAISLTQGAISVAGGVSNVKSAAGNGAIQGAAGGAAGMIAGGIAGGLQAIPQAASGAIGYVGDVGNSLLGGQQVEPQMVGQFSPNGAIYAPQQPYLIISRPVTLSTNMLSYYSDLNGRSASYYGAVSEFTKYLQISEMDLVVSSIMTIQEQNEIISLMKSGVYVTE